MSTPTNKELPPSRRLTDPLTTNVPPNGLPKHISEPIPTPSPSPSAKDRARAKRQKKRLQKLLMGYYTPAGTKRFVPMDKERLRELYQRRVDPASLNGRLRKNQGLSLFARPVFWTDTHSLLLGVRFRALPDPALGTPPTHTNPAITFTRCTHLTSSQQVDSETALRAIINQSDSKAHDYSDVDSMASVLEGLFPGVFSDENIRYIPNFNISFGDMVYRNVNRVQALWHYPQERQHSTPDSSPVANLAAVDSGPDDFAVSFCSEATHLASASFEVPSSPVTPSSPPSSSPPPPPPPPMLAYMGWRFVQLMRSNLFRASPGLKNTSNKPVDLLMRLRNKLLYPAHPEEDAYIASIFITIAQEHSDITGPITQLAQNPGQQIPPRQLEDVKFRFLCEDRNLRHFVVYTAVVTADYMRQFRNPDREIIDPKTGETPTLDIDYVKVPFLPYSTLQLRLGRALGTDIVGEEKEIEVSPDTPRRNNFQRSDSPETPSRKRKRNADRDSLVSPPESVGEREGSPLREVKRRRISGNKSVKIA